MADVADLLLLYEARRFDDNDNLPDFFFVADAEELPLAVVAAGGALLLLLRLDDLRSSVSSKLLADKLLPEDLLLEKLDRLVFLLLVIAPSLLSLSKEDVDDTAELALPVLRDRALERLLDLTVMPAVRC